MPIISIVNVKGGTGKTMTVINLAGAIAKNGKKVLVIDNDSQSSLTNILFGSNVANFEKNLFDIYENRDEKISNVIQKVNDNVSVVPNTIKSSILEKSLHNKITREGILKKRRPEILSLGFDIILIDNSPFLGLMVHNALGMSDYYMEVIDNSMSALQGLKIVRETIKEIKDSGLNEDIKELGILRNKFDKVTNYTKQFNEFLSEEKYNLFETIIYETVKLKEANITNSFIQDYSKEHASQYDSLFNELVKKINI